jgi:Tol biopolymer transport system component
MTADGRYIAFSSQASNLVLGDTNGAWDEFVRDRIAGTIERVSVATNGTEANADSHFPTISADGRYVAFLSYASNLVPGDTNGYPDVFVHDRQSGTTERVSVATGGQEGDGLCYDPTISANGRYVAFASAATNLIVGDTNGAVDVFVRDMQNGTTSRVSIGTSGYEPNGGSGVQSISADGRYIAFESVANNLAQDLNMLRDVFVHDCLSGQTSLVSVASNGAQGNEESSTPAISPDGRYVAFLSRASNLVPGDTNGRVDVFVHDCQGGSTTRVSIGRNGIEGDQDSAARPSMSADGRYVAFGSAATNLVDDDTNHQMDVFVRDRRDGLTSRVSVASSGAQALWGLSSVPSMSPDGRYVVFDSFASNLVSGDTNGFVDVFVRDRIGGTSFTSLCDPGAGGVVACPCSNAPSGPDRGCDNSSGTGGAVLSASGGTFLSSDSLTFTTRDERPTALSILTQWTGTNATGAIFGMGVRCTSGTFKRLFTKTAIAGSITAPDFNAGDPQVSVRSEARGDTILAGQSRYYLVYYRDPNVLGGCPASSTFNATQTGQVTWWP